MFLLRKAGLFPMHLHDVKNYGCPREREHFVAKFDGTPAS